MTDRDPACGQPARKRSINRERRRIESRLRRGEVVPVGDWLMMLMDLPKPYVTPTGPPLAWSKEVAPPHPVTTRQPKVKQ